MKKKLLALFAACSMITTAVAGLVQTAYAEGMSVRIEVTDVAGSDTQKVLTFYYEGVDTVTMVEGTLSFDNAGVTMESAEVTITYPSGMGDKCFNMLNHATQPGYVMFTYYDDGGISSADNSFATANITVPSDVDVTATFAIENMVDGDWNMYDATEVEVVIPKKEVAPPEPVVSKSVENSAAYTEADGYDANVVVGTIQLDVTDAAIDLTAATYKGQTPTKVEGYDEPTSFIGSALITVIINGETDPEALSQIVFN